MIAASGCAGADAVVDAPTAVTEVDTDPIRASEVFICRKCGAIVARGHEYLPDSPEGKRLLATISEPELGADGKVLEFQQPGSTDAKQLALFKQSESTV
jgi:hypothetical protein